MPYISLFEKYLHQLNEQGCVKVYTYAEIYGGEEYQKPELIGNMSPFSTHSPNVYTLLNNIDINNQ